MFYCDEKFFNLYSKSYLEEKMAINPALSGTKRRYLITDEEKDIDLWDKIDQDAALILAKLAGHYKKERDEEEQVLSNGEKKPKKMKKEVPFFAGSVERKEAEVPQATLDKLNEKTGKQWRSFKSFRYKYKPASFFGLKKTILSLMKYVNFVHEAVGEIFPEEVANEFYDKYPDKISCTMPTHKTFLKGHSLSVILLDGFWGEGKTSSTKSLGYETFEPDMLYRAKVDKDAFLASTRVIPFALWGIICDFFAFVKKADELKEKFSQDPDSYWCMARSWLSHQFFNFQRHKSKVNVTEWKGGKEEKMPLQILEIHYLGLLKLATLYFGWDTQDFNIHILLAYDSKSLDTFVESKKHPWPIVDYRTMEQYLYPTEESLIEGMKEFITYIQEAQSRQTEAALTEEVDNVFIKK